jgi:lincosamide nucleotidyltransferase A/C/D/E
MVAEMRAEDALDFYNRATELGIVIWIDGGWGVDALLEQQTRPHEDLDIAVQEKDVAALRGMLAGYSDVPRGDSSAWNFVLGDDRGRLIDFHVIVLDEHGNGIYGPKENGNMYPASSLTGIGRISGTEVKCISPEDMVKFHTGYEVDENDYRDVLALCKKFGLELPEDFNKFVGR